MLISLGTGEKMERGKITLDKCRKTHRGDGLKMKTVVEYTFPSLLDAVESRYGNSVCYRVFNTDIAITYGELKCQAHAISTYLINIGIQKEDKVAIIGESSPMWMLMYLGIVSIGAIAVPVLPDFSGYDIESILATAQVKAIAVSKKHMQKIKNVKTNMVFCLDDMRPVKDRTNTLEDSAPVTETVIDEKAIRERKPQENDIASIIFTSGTTGTSKGVMLSHMNLIRCADIATDAYIRLKPGMKVLSILPMAHVYEFTLGEIIPLMMRLEVTFLGKQPAPSIVMAALKEVRPHIMFSVPLLIEKVYKSAVAPMLEGKGAIPRLIKNPLLRPLIYRLIGHKIRKKFGGRLVFFGIGGAPLDSETEAFLHKIHFPYAIGYGLTETSPLIAGCKPTYKDQRLGYIGKIVSDDDVILLSKNDEGIGEVAVKGPNVMKGYYKRDNLNSDVFTPDGYFRTGDLGYIDEMGRLSIRGRVKTMILGPGGENIFPEAIESLINNEKYVDESLVIPEDGGLVALVRLNLEQMQKTFNIPIEELEKETKKYLSQLKKEINSRLSSFSKLTGIREQKLPFERTPTLKIKRFLYDGSTC